MNGRFGFLIGTAVTVLILAACAGPTASPTPAGGPAGLITPGTLVDCVDIEYPPMEYFPAEDVTDPAQAIGFDVDSAKAVAAHWGIDIEIRNTGFDSLIDDLTNNRCDIVWTSLFVNDTRLQVAEAVPYLATGHVVMVKKGNPGGITTLADLCGKSVSIQSGGLVEEKINDQSAACTTAGSAAIDIQGYQTVADEFAQIVSDRVPAVWETDTAIADWMVKHPDEYEVAFVVSRDDAYGVYFQKGKAALATALQDALKAIKGDGSWADIADEYAQDPEALGPACPASLTVATGCHAVP
ncbi:MAG: polar amino acid transport system substrate-binding protein [Chloroflexota bacterium]|jgi:ABC-type amino acid transport substrate-binding protein|nr:polar amino acid transport system substrate-binding protein [Chloroflexota bacterium]